MVVGGAIVSDVNNIMGGMESTAGVKLHNHRRKLRQRFDLVRKLGQGTYGKVQLGINKETGQEVAIKTIKKAKIETEADLIRIRREIQIMSSVRHPNIIHIYEVFENKEKMVLVMEYAAGGELYDYLSERKVLSEIEARRVFRQVASAVYYCHKHKICHRDLKLENILLDVTRNAKIADFGLSNVFDERNVLTTFCGSPLYASPEIVRGTPYLGPEVDCWSLGVLLYTLVYGAMPFDGSNFKRLVKQISSGEYYEPKKPSPASPLIRHMLTVDPAKRATVEDICSHWWVNEGYAESCLEVAEDLANQTPVRLDLLISLMPPPTNSDAVLIGKLDSSTASPPVTTTNDVECDSMNEYYSAHSNATNVTEAAEDAPSPDKKSKKKKDKDKDREKDATKRKREDASVPDLVAHKKQETGEVKELPDQTPIQHDERKNQLPSSSAKSPTIAKNLDDIRHLDQDQETNLAPKEDVSAQEENMDVEEGVSTSSSWTAANFDPALKERAAGLSSQGGTPVLSDKESSVPPLSPLELEPAVSLPQGGESGAAEAVKRSEEESSQVASAFAGSNAVKQVEESSIPLLPQTKESPEIVPAATTEAKTSVPEESPKQEVKTPDEAKVDREVKELLSKTGSTVTTPLEEQKAAREDSASAVPVTLSPTQLEKRNSKILRQAEIFNTLMGSKTEPRTMTLERPKKVSDTRRMYEAKPESRKPTVVPALKVSDAKRAFEISAATAKPTSASHNSLPRRTLIQTPSSGSSTSSKEHRQSSGSSTNQSQRSSTTEDDQNEKVVVGGLGVKIGAVGKVTEIGMKVKTEKSKDSFDEKSSEKESFTINSVPPQVAQPNREPSALSAVSTVPAKITTGPSKAEVNPAPLVTPAVSKAVVPEEAKIKKLKSPNLKLTMSSPKASEANKEIDVVIDTGGAEPKKAAMLISGSTAVHGQDNSEVSSPPARVISPPPGQTKAAGPPSVPPKPAKGPPAARVSSPPHCGVRTLERREKFEKPAEKQEEETTLAGSENMFLRSLRSPGREAQEAKKRNSKIQTESAEATVIIPVAAQPCYKTEISGNVSAAPTVNMPAPAVPAPQVPAPPHGNAKPAQSKLAQRTEVSISVGDKTAAANPQLQKQQSLRERIIPIQVEGRAEPPAKPVLSAQNSVNSSTSTLTRMTSPPPVTKPSMGSRQESVRSPTPSDTESLRIREPIRKSPREFIIPISVEGGGFVTPKEVLASPPALSGRTSQASARQKSSHLDRTKRFGGFFNDFASESEDSSASAMHSPPHTLQRLSSFGKGYGDIRLEEQKRRNELQRSGSGSSGDDDDDDDTFQILTAESLFSTLLSRVRQLTRRTNRDGGDPFAGAFRSSRYTSPAPSSSSTATLERNGNGSAHRYSTSASQSRTEQPEVQSPPVSSVASPGIHEGSVSGSRNRNSFASDTGPPTGTVNQDQRGFWTSLYSRAPSVASDSASRRYSTLDSPRHGLNREEWNNSMPWRNRSTSRDASDTESVYSTPATATLPRDGGTSDASDNLDGRYPFTSSLTRRVLNQHLRETNPELVQQQQQPQRASRLVTDESSDARSDISSASESARSSLSWALSRLSSVLGDPNPGQSRKEYGRTHSSKELGSSNEGRRYQRYGRASTSDGINRNSLGRLGSPVSQSDEEGSSQGTTSYRTYTRTCSREYLSPSGSRGTSPTPPPPPVSNLAPQLSTVLENGPMGPEGESPRPGKKIPVAVISSTSEVVNSLNNNMNATTEENGRKTQRVSRFLRPDFFDPPVEESKINGAGTKLSEADDAKQKFLRMVEKRWEKFRAEEAKNGEPKPVKNGPEYKIAELRRITPDEAAPKKSEPRIVIEVRISEGKPKSRPEENRPPPELKSNMSAADLLKIQREQLTTVEAKAAENAPKTSTKSVEQQNGKQKLTKSDPAGNSASKNSPKLNVRRQFEHLLNLAAAQFQRSQSPAKQPHETVAAQQAQPDPVVHRKSMTEKPAVPAKPDHLTAVKRNSEYLPENGAVGPLPSEGKEITSLSRIAVSDEVSGKASLPTQGNTKTEDNGDGENIKFAKIKRLEAIENNHFEYPDEIPGTPTDSYESSSVCSDLRDREMRDMGDEESVSERILRKSFYSRFNDSTKSKSKHRRSSTKEIMDLSSHSSSNLASPPANSSVLPPRLPTKVQRLPSRDESAEALMVRKFLSRPTEVDSVTLDRERRLSTTRRQISENSEADAESRKSFSRESSLVRTAPTSPLSESGAAARESRSYVRSTTQRQLTNDYGAKPSTDYSTSSLNRRSYYGNTADSTGSLPRRMNRYSTYEPDVSHSLAGSSTSSNTFSSNPLRSSLVNHSSTPSRSALSPTSRYSAILEESSSNPWSPSSGRRTSGLSDLSTRRETSFYGTPSSRDSSLSRRGDGASSFYSRSTSTGLDYGGNSSGSASGSTYATIRPTSYLRHRR